MNISLVIHRSGHLPATATQSPSTTGPSAARVMIFIVMQLYDGGTVLEMMNSRLERGFSEQEVPDNSRYSLLCVCKGGDVW